MLQPQLQEQLIADIQAIISNAKMMIEKRAQRIMIDAYWQIGKRLTTDSFIINESSYERTLAAVAQATSLDRTTLSRVMQLYRVFPEESPTAAFPRVSWSHYRFVLPLADPATRQFYLTRAQESSWSVRDLNYWIDKDLYHTSAMTAETGAVSAEPQAPLERHENLLHLYAGIVERVIDGDTLLVRIDLGFEVWVSKRMRLRGIDTPELSTPAGEQAQAFVRAQLKPAERIVVQTYFIDRYGRYVCDVFYLPGETNRERIARNGFFLNQQVLDAGLAVRYE